MWKKRISLISAIVLLVGAIAMVAVAQDDGDGSGEGKVELHGVGALWARGTGVADLDVDQARVQMRLIGNVTITGPADLDVRIDGIRQFAPESDGGTTIVLTDFDGRIAVQGQDFTIDAEGELALRGRGGGSASFYGEGHWKTRHDRGHWDGVAVELTA